jgi:hypothetical protein
MGDTTEKILLQLELNIDQLQANLQKTRDGLELLGKQQARVNLELSELEKKGVTSGATYDNLKKKSLEYEVQSRALTKEQQNYTRQLVLVQQANQAAEGSLDQLKISLSAMNAQWSALSKEERENTDEGKALAKSIADTTNKLNEQEQATGNFRRQVGNYEIGVKSLKQQIREATVEATNLTQKFGENSQVAVLATKKVSELKEEMDDFNKRVAALNPEQKFAAFAQVASGIAGGFAAAEGAMALFGTQSEAVGQALLKVQGALAFAQGLKQVAELGDAFKSLRLVLGLTTLSTQQNAAATEVNSVAQVEGGAAAEVMAAGENVATAATGRLSLAMRALLVGSGLILIPLAVSAATEAFKIFGSEAKVKIDVLTDAIKSENEAHKLTVEQIKLKNDATIGEAEIALASAKAKGASEEELSSLQQNILNKRLDGLRVEAQENNEHLDQLIQKQKTFSDEYLQSLSEDDLKKAQEQKTANEAEIQATKNKNQELLNEANKLKSDLVTTESEAAEKIKAIKNNAINIRIGLIRDEKKRELEAEKEALAQKLDAIKGSGEAEAQLRQALAEESAQKIKDIRLKFSLQEVQDRNKLEIALTGEGTQARLDAEIAAAGRERDALLKNDTLTKTQRALIRAEYNNQVAKFEDERLQLLQDESQKELELEQRKQKALVAIQSSQANQDLVKQFEAKLAAIQTNFESERATLDKQTDDRVAIVQREIEEKKKSVEQGTAEINAINEAADAEGLALLLKHGEDTLAATTEFNQTKLGLIVSQRQLEVEAADPSEEFAAKLALLDAAEKEELASLTLTETQKDLIRKKYAKQRAQVEKQQEDTTLDMASNTLGALAGLFKKQTAAYKIFATAQALIDTYKAITLALATYPPPYGEIAAGVAGAVGFANVAKINEVGFFDGGYTGDGNPREVSHTPHTTYTKHKREYIIPDRLLSLPEVGSYVSNVIEPMRRRSYIYSTPRSFGSGGFAESTFSIEKVGALSAETVQNIVSSTVEGMMKNFPEIVTNVRDVINETGIITKVEDRSTI